MQNIDSTDTYPAPDNKRLQKLSHHNKTIACFAVAGKVQGVWFRAHTQAQAQTLGLLGYAKNLPDGRVQVLAIGEDGAIDALRQWLVQGAPQSQVRVITPAPLPAPDVLAKIADFSVL